MKEFLMIVPGQPGLSALLLATLAMIVLYIGRAPAHGAIRASARVLCQGLRLSARAVHVGQEKLHNRNREVLLAAGRDELEKHVEQEFYRVHKVVNRDLASYPALHRKLSEQVKKVDDDYQKATDSPPDPPDWVSAVDKVAKLTETGDSMAVGVLKSINKSMTAANTKIMKDYREASAKRHSLLKGMMPHWRNVDKTLKEVDRTISGLDARSKTIDGHMDRYENILKGTNEAERKLSSSSLTQFFISGLVLFIAIMGAIINFNLIALPMSEMVGARSMIGGMPTSEVAALVIIMIEIAMGLFLMESLRITRLFPVIHALDDKLRRWMLWISFSILTILAMIEASLAYMRDMIAADNAALTQSLAGAVVTAESVNAAFTWIPQLGQMTLGLILPFALTFVAIPLESFVHSTRTVLGLVFVGLLRALSFTLRLLGHVVHHIGATSVAIYDLLIFIPLRIEMAMVEKSRNRPKPKAV